VGPGTVSIQSADAYAKEKEKEGDPDRWDRVWLLVSREKGG
jgi:hypothetical protein